VSRLAPAAGLRRDAAPGVRLPAALVVLPVRGRRWSSWGCAGGGIEPRCPAAEALRVDVGRGVPVPIEVTAGLTSFANVFIVTAAVVYDWRTAVVIGALRCWRSRLPTDNWSVAYNSFVRAGGGRRRSRAQPSERQGEAASVAPLRRRRDPAGSGPDAIGESNPARRPRFFSTLPPFVVMAAITPSVQLWRSRRGGACLVPPWSRSGCTSAAVGR
jgi:hypothetical protein